MSAPSTPATQLLGEVAPVVEALGRLLGTDLADQMTQRLDDRAAMLASDAHDPGTAADLLILLGDRDATWWGTPLGREVAAGAGDTMGVLTQQQAADVLGVSRGTVAQLVSRGTLDRHPDGGVVLGSVLMRLTRLRSANVETSPGEKDE